MARDITDIRSKMNEVVYGITFNKDALNKESRDSSTKSPSLRGMQNKWGTNGYYVKEDTPEYKEGLSEVIASKFASCISSLKSVSYYPCKIVNEDSYTIGCFSANFKKFKETEKTLNDIGESTRFVSLLDDNVITKYDNVFSEIGIDKQDIINTWLFDAIILNPDRHYNNITLLVDNSNNYRLAPIYDNGLALCARYTDYLLCDTMEEIVQTASPYIYKLGNHDDFLSMLKYKPLEIDINKVYSLKSESIAYYNQADIDYRWELLLYNLERTEGLYWKEKV